MIRHQRTVGIGVADLAFNIHSDNKPLLSMVSPFSDLCWPFLDEDILKR